MRFARSLRDAFPAERYAAVEVFTPARRVPARRPLVVALLAVAALSSAFSAGRASAAEFEPTVAVMGGWHSKHYGAAPGKFNEDNLGAGVQYRTSPGFAYTAGVYRNSIRRTSAYAGVAWSPIALGAHVRLGLFGGLVTGYDAAPVVPFGGPMIEATFGRVIVQGVLIPRIGDLNPYTVGAIRVGVSF
jgi:hypothetical protein